MSTRIMYTYREAAERVGLSRRTLYRKVEAGTFPAPRRLHGNRVAFHRDDLEAWAAALPVNGRKVAS